MAQNIPRKVTLRQLRGMKARHEPIVALGVYDSPMAAWADALGFEMFIIGNSGPMSLFGHRSSTTVKPQELLFMTQAVSRVTQSALIVATMPYMSYCASREESVRTAAWLVAEGGADGVQCHGNRHTAPFIAAIVNAGIPVLAHLGLQSVRKTEQSGYGVKGRDAAEAEKIVADASALVEAGAFAILLELVPEEITKYLSSRLDVPVLSLGSGLEGDGVYLVSADLTGYSVARKPSTAGDFIDVRPIIEGALHSYLLKARKRAYPHPSLSRHMSAEEMKRFRSLIQDRSGASARKKRGRRTGGTRP